MSWTYKILYSIFKITSCTTLISEHSTNGTRSSANAEIARHVSHLLLPQKCKILRFWHNCSSPTWSLTIILKLGPNNHAMSVSYSLAHFSIPSSSVELRITEYYDPGQLWHAGSQDTGLYPVMHQLHFLLHYVITIHQCNRQTDRHHAHSISVTCDVYMSH